jgi:uncharacterized RDD family membrane protein YckC
MAQGSEQLNTTIHVVTPENIAFEYRIAGPSRRFLAYLIDVLVRAFVLVAAWIVLGLLFSNVGLGGFGDAIFMLVAFVSSWFYGGLLETYWNGQTVGKKLLGLRVLTFEGQPINGMQAVMRNILRTADSLPPGTFLVGVLVASMNSRFQRLGDLACGTMVVIEQSSWLRGLTRIDDPLVVRLASELPPKFEPSKSLAQALAAYVERRKYFSPGRRADIARHVGQPLCEKFNLLPDTSHDLLLCALYHRTFIADHSEEVPEPSGPFPGLPNDGPPPPLSIPEITVS